MTSMAALFALSWVFPVQDWVQAFSAWIGGLGAWGVLIYAAAYAGALVVLLPAAPFTLGAGLIYGLWGFPVALFSATLGASLAFLVSRHLVRGRVARLIAGRPGLRAIDRAVGEEGWRVVALLRLSPLVPFNLQNYACGVSSIGFWPYVAATGAGIAPGCLLYVYLGVAGRAASGGFTAYVAARLGLRVALIERGRMGGECLNVGCVPSKALLAAAHAAHAVRRAGRYGIRAPAPGIDWPNVQAHVHGAITTLAPADSVERYTDLGATVLQGTARFVARDALAVAIGPDTRRLSARRIVIATGSRPAVPDLPGLDQVPFLTNDTLFDLTEAPEHLLILGGGPIGLEMAQAHARLGCRVTLVQSGAIGARDDPELVAGLRAALQADGVAILEHARVAEVRPGPVLVLADGRTVAGSLLLVAAGRRPTLERLDLAAGRVAATPRGIDVDLGLRSRTNRFVYAAGDVADPQGVGPRYFTHVGSYHAGIIVRRALFRAPARLDYAALPRVTYTDPELAQVGLTEAEARAAGHAVETLRWPLAENDRAVAEGDTAGLVKLVVSGNRVLGAGILAPHAGEMVGAWTLAITQRIKLSALAGMIVPYPTRAEAGKRAAGTRFSPRLFAPKPRLVARLMARLP